MVEGAWKVEAELSINPTSRTLLVSPRLSFQCEGGPAIPVSWRLIESEDDGIEVNEGALVLQPRTKRVSFVGWSDPQSHPVDAREATSLLDVVTRVEGDA